MSKTIEIARFSNTGKTFFFNRGQAKNGTDYLAINTLYGQGNRERLVLFPSHFLEFYKHLSASIEKLTGFTANGQAPKPFVAPIKCPDCGSGSASWRVITLTSKEMKIVCNDCDEVVKVMVS